MKKKNQTSNSNRYWLLGLSLICILLMLLSVFSDRISGPIRTIADVTVIPMQKGINQVGGLLNDFSENFQTLKQVREENKALQNKVDELIMENNILQENKYEL